jgi:hypothetical protein
VALADAPDRGIAGHLTQGFDAVGQQQGTASHARTGQRRLGTGMAATDYDYIKFFRILRHWVRCDLELPPAPGAGRE